MHASSPIILVRVEAIVAGFPCTGAHPLIIIFPLCLQNIDQACAALFLYTDPSQAAAKFPFFKCFTILRILDFVTSAVPQFCFLQSVMVVKASMGLCSWMCGRFCWK